MTSNVDEINKELNRVIDLYEKKKKEREEIDEATNPYFDRAFVLSLGAPLFIVSIISDLFNSMIWCIVCWALMTVGCLMLFGYYVRSKCKDEQLWLHIEEEESAYNKLKFLQACFKQGVYDLDTRKNRERIVLIAENTKAELKIEDPEAAFREAMEVLEQELSKLREIDLEKQKKEEKQQYWESLRYVRDHGRRKQLHMLSDLLEECTGELSGYNEISRAMNKREVELSRESSSWAVAGGAASAIAGPAAGLAVAMDTKQRAEEQRARDRVMFDALTPMRNMTYHNAALAREKAERLQKAIDDTQVSLMDDQHQQKYFDLLEIQLDTMKIEETGTCRIDIQVKAKKKAFVLDNVPAMIDGVLLGELYAGDVKIDTVQFVLPLYGVSKDRACTASGMSLYTCEQNKEYRLEFKPQDIWAIERINFA